MKWLSTLVFSLAFLAISSPADAHTANFTATVANFAEDLSTPPQVQANFSLTDVNIHQSGTFTVTYTVTLEFSGAVIFTGSASLMDGQRSVTVGDISSGLITLKYKKAAGEIISTFAKDDPGHFDQVYDIQVQTNYGWNGFASVASEYPE